MRPCLSRCVCGARCMGPDSRAQSGCRTCTWSCTARQHFHADAGGLRLQPKRIRMSGMLQTLDTHTHAAQGQGNYTTRTHTPPCLHTLHAASHAHRAWPHASAPMRNRAATIVRACAALPTPHRTWRLEPYFRHHLCRVLLEDKLLLLSSPPVKQRAHLLDAQPLQPVVVPACVHQPCTCASGCRAWPGGAGRARAGAPCISVQAVYRTRTTGVTGEPAEHGKVEVWLPLPQAGPLAGPPEQAARGLIAPAGSGTGKRTSSARPAPRQPSARPPLLQTCA